MLQQHEPSSEQFSRSRLSYLEKFENFKLNITVTYTEMWKQPTRAHAGERSEMLSGWVSYKQLTNKVLHKVNLT